jgi:site-specific DNA recombinase
MMLTDVANIGVLQILKYTSTISAKGKPGMKRNDLMRTIPNGLPAIVPVHLYERALAKLKTNKVDKSHLHRNPEDFLLKGHVICATCGYAMVGRYRTSRKTHTYPYYACTHNRNKYMACPEQPLVRTYKIDEVVWVDCCRVFEQLEAVQSTIERSIREYLDSMLENTHGSQQIADLRQQVLFAEAERDKHPKGSYYYNLTDKDVLDKLDKLHRYEMEYGESRNIVRLSEVYTNSVLGFLTFLNTMRGRYHEATFQDRRNALEVLGVRVSIYPKEGGEVRTEITYTPMFTGVYNSLG